MVYISKLSKTLDFFDIINLKKHLQFEKARKACHDFELRPQQMLRKFMELRVGYFFQSILFFTDTNISLVTALIHAFYILTNLLPRSSAIKRRKGGHRGAIYF